MKKFGMVIAIATELEKVLTAFGKVDSIEKTGAYEVYRLSRDNAQLYLVASGIGEIAAAAATQMLISEYKVSAIFNFGFVGALNSSLKCQQIVIVKDVVHYEIDTSAIDDVPAGRYLDFDDVFIPTDKKMLQTAVTAFPALQAVRLASGDKFISSEEVKQRLQDKFAADICDMEGAAVIITAARNKKPVLSVKVVSDNADEGGAVSFKEIAYKGTASCAAILTKLVEILSK